MRENCKFKEILFETGMGFSAYWFANSVLWIPWKLNKYFGIAVMILLVPVLWGGVSLFCLKRIHKEQWKVKKYLVAIIFLLIGIVSDYFFFAIWRKIPDELYKPTTFAAYGLLFFMPIVVGSFKNYIKNEESYAISNKNVLCVWIAGIFFLTMTLFSVKYW